MLLTHISKVYMPSSQFIRHQIAWLNTVFRPSFSQTRKKNIRDYSYRFLKGRIRWQKSDDILIRIDLKET